MMLCRVEKENRRLKKHIKELEKQHKADIKKIRELLTTGAKHERNNNNADNRGD